MKRQSPLFTNPNNTWILLALVCALSLLIMDATILSVSLPSIRRDLGLELLPSQWVINSYLITLASLVFAGGRIADIFGHRKIFVVGLLIYCVGALIGGVAQSGYVLIGGRVVQGIGSSLFGPASYALLYDHFSIKERGRAVGIVVGISSAFITLGPFAGGAISQLWNWRFVFLLPFFFIIPGLFLTLKYCQESQKKAEHVDLKSFLALTSALITLTFALMSGQNKGWHSLSITSLLLLSALFFFLFFRANKRAKHPFMHSHLMKNRLFLRGNLMIFGIQSIMMMTVLMPVYFQTALGMSPTKAGLWMVLESLPVIFFGPLSGFISDRYGPYLPASLGFKLIACSFALFIVWVVYSNLTILALSLILLGCGLSLAMTPVSTSTLSSVDQNYNGEGTGFYNSVRYFSQSVSLSLICSLFNTIGLGTFERLVQRDDAAHLWEQLDTFGLAVSTDPLVTQSYILGSNIGFISLCFCGIGISLGCLTLGKLFFQKFEILHRP